MRDIIWMSILFQFVQLDSNIDSKWFDNQH